MLTFLKTAAVLLVMSLVLPLFLWGATGHLRNSLRAWWSWWKYMLVAVVLVGGFALLQFAVGLAG